MEEMQGLPNNVRIFFYYAVSEIKRVKPDVIVATPGRLIDLCTNYGL